MRAATPDRPYSKRYDLSAERTPQFFIFHVSFFILQKEGAPLPASYTHYCFGRDVLAALPPSLQARIAPCRQLFDIGIHGPDVFFYNHPLTKNPVNRMGYAMHDQPGRTVFRRFAALDDGSDGAFAYLAGFLCHFALDSSCHGYVEQMVAQGVSHCRLETQLDRCFLLADGEDPVTRDPVAHLRPTAENARIMAAFFPQATERQVQGALAQMVFFHHLLMAKSAPKRALLDGVFTVMKAKDGFGAMVMTREDDPVCRPMVRHLRELYEAAVPLAAALIEAYPDLSHPQYRLDFEGQAHDLSADC